MRAAWLNSCDVTSLKPCRARALSGAVASTRFIEFGGVLAGRRDQKPLDAVGAACCSSSSMAAWAAAAC